MRTHINAQGQFQSDKYPTTPPGKVPLSVKDKSAMDLLWAYAQRHRMKDAEFSDDLQTCLLAEGYQPPPASAATLDKLLWAIADLPGGSLGYIQQSVPPYKQDLIPHALAGLRAAIEAEQAKANQEQKP